MKMTHHTALRQSAGPVLLIIIVGVVVRKRLRGCSGAMCCEDVPSWCSQAGGAAEPSLLPPGQDMQAGSNDVAR